MKAHLATIWESVADAIPDAIAIVQGERRVTWQAFDDRSARLGTALETAGLDVGSKVGIFLYNSVEFLETYNATLKMRMTPFNVNYRYLDEELLYLFDNADAEGVVVHASLAARMANIIDRLPQLKIVVVVDDLADVSTTDELNGLGGGTATWIGYEAAVTAHRPAVRIERSNDDITMTYTGGTTGMPKGVISKVGPAGTGLMVTLPPLLGLAPLSDPAQIPVMAQQLLADGRQFTALPAPPLMHATGLGIGAVPALFLGGKVVLLVGRGLDVDELWSTVEREGVNSITIVGDPFARPMLRGLREGPPRDTSSVIAFSSSGAMFSTDIKSGLHEHIPNAFIIDFIASTEGTMGMSISTAAHPAVTGRFTPGPGVIVVAEDDRLIEAGSEEIGFVAVPGGAEGYYKDEEKTAKTFRMINGVRYTIPGDFAMLDADGSIILLGRGSQCINTGGEKVYPEEVEEIIKSHDAIDDCLIFGVEDERFGQRVVGVVSRAPGSSAIVLSEVIADARTRLAAYKVPRELVEVEVVPRTAAGKADYPNAIEMFNAAPR